MLLFLWGVVLAWATLLTTFTLGHPVEMLKFNFQDVARDQFWYFAPYSEGSRIFQFPQLFRLFGGNIFPLLVLLLCFVIALKTKSLHNALLFCIGLTLFGGGALASIGGHLGGYFVAFYLWGFITILFFSLHLFCNLIAKSFSSRSTDLILLIISACFMSTLCFLTYNKYKETVSLASNDTQRFFVEELSAFLPVTWRGYIDYVRVSKGKIVIEEYWGIWSAMQKIFSPWPVDSVIHALGSKREVAKSALPEADIIVTTRHSASLGWQSWNLRQNFWFYDELFNNYSAKEESPTTIVWEKDVRSRISTDIIPDCRVSSDQQSLELNIPFAGFYKVQVEFDFSSRKGRHLLLINNNIGEVSIEPRSGKAFFPAYFSTSGINILSFKILGNSSYKFSVLSCSSKKIDFDNSEILWAPSFEEMLREFYLTDENWINGVARRWPGFFLPNTPENYSRFQVGKIVKCANSEEREIIKAEPSGAYLNIFLNGPILDPNLCGRPDSYTVK